MVNRIRGEVSIPLANRTVVVALTTSAAAALEEAFGIDDFVEALAHVVPRGRVSARGTLKFIITVAEANGHALTDADRAYLGAMHPLDLFDVAAAILKGAGILQDKEGTQSPPGSAGESDGISGSASPSAT